MFGPSETNLILPATIRQPGGVNPYLVFGLELNGSNGGTTFPDQIVANSWSANYHAQTSTTQSKYGGSALYVDGPAASGTPPLATTACIYSNTGGRVSIADYTKNFVIGGWFYFDNLANIIIVGGHGPVNSSGTYNGFYIGSISNKLQFTYYPTSTTFTNLAHQTTITATAWHSFVVTGSYSAGSQRIHTYLDAVQDSSTWTRSANSTAPSSNVTRLGCGLNNATTAWFPMKGYLQRVFMLNNMPATWGQAEVTAFHNGTLNPYAA